MTTPRIFCPLLIIMATVLVSPACYTLLKHPRIDTTAYGEADDSRCASCHHEDEVWSYHHPPNHRYYSGAGNYYDWGFYYAVPWWYGANWYDTPPDRQTVRYGSRLFRPTGGGNPSVGATGGPVGSPPPPKSTGGSVRAGHDEDARKGETSEKKSKKRTVRPRAKKGKENG